MKAGRGVEEGMEEWEANERIEGEKEEQVQVQVQVFGRPHAREHGCRERRVK